MTASPALLAEPVLPFGYVLTAFDLVGSTNDEAKRLAVSGAPHGTVVWAREQSAGRGRQARQWVSSRGNLFASLVLRPSRQPSEASNLGFVAALAVADVVRGFCPDSTVSLKWPNDVLIDGPPLFPSSSLEGEEEKKPSPLRGRGLGEANFPGSKVSGILLESSIAQSGSLDWLVLGIGINLIIAPSNTPYKAAALSDFADPPSPERALTDLIWAFDRWFAVWQREGFAPIRAAWLESGTRPGTPITVYEGSGSTDGIFMDLDVDGALIFNTAHGQRRITAGDVFFRS